ncbi:MAG: hypothetical protein HY762_05190, partial [Planctomycetes bacterium]|nr:hypothetical protein [Planctomycetota bacterium]
MVAEQYAQTKSQIESDGKTVSVDYLIRYMFPKEGADYLIKGKQGVKTVNEKYIRKYEWQGKVSIPEGKAVFIECQPSGT